MIDKTKVFLLGKDNKNWSIDKDRKHAKYFLEQMEDIELIEDKHKILFSDIVYCVWYNFLDNLRVFYLIKLLKKIKGIKVVAVVTNQVSLYEERFENIKALVDLWVYPNKEIGNFLKEKNVECKYIPFYVDKEIFKKTDLSKKKICDHFNLDYERLKDKFLIGSFQRDSNGNNLLKPKWQKDPDFLIKVMKKLPKDKIELILGGPRRHYIVNKAKEENISYTFVGNKEYIKNNRDDFRTENNLSTEDVSLLYNLIDLYLITSESESGPKAILESSICNTLIMSTNVGMSTEVLHPKLIYDKEDIDLVVEFIKDIIFNKIRTKQYLDYNRNKAFDLLDESKMKERYREVIDF